VFALLFGATPASAANWYLTGESTYGSSVTFVDKDSIEGSGTLRQAQIYLVMAEHQEGAPAMDVLVEFDCAEPRNRVLRLVSFSEAGGQIGDEPGSGRWSPVEPGTQAASTRDFACSDGRSLPPSESRGAAYPFAAGRALLARHRAEDAK
jgi:hypothetical protein